MSEYMLMMSKYTRYYNLKRDNEILNNEKYDNDM